VAYDNVFMVLYILMGTPLWRI